MLILVRDVLKITITAIKLVYEYSLILFLDNMLPFDPISYLIN